MRIENKGSQAVVGTAVLAVLAWGGCGSSNEHGEVHEAHEVHAEASEHEQGEHEEGEDDDDDGDDDDRGEHEHGEHERGEHGGHERGEHGEHERGEHGLASGPVSDFHALMGPLWHADQGTTRTNGTCQAIADFRAKAAAIESGPVPQPAQADESGYRQAGAALKTAVEGLATACATESRSTFDARFLAVHEAFHRVLEAVGGERH